MIANIVYDIACGYVSEKPQKEYIRNLSINWINTLLFESLNTENSIRQSLGMEQLTTAPIIKSITDDIDYRDSLLRVSIPYGLASFIYRNDDDGDGRADYYRNLFISSLNDFETYNDSEVKDVYWGDE